MDASTYDAVRDWTGEGDDDEVAAALGRTGGDPDRAALSILRRRLAGMDVETFSVAGDYSQNGSGQRAWLTRQIARLERLTGDVAAGADLPVVTVGRLCRPDTDR